jgi:phosphoglycerate dehydrogenase-like enzyme
MQVSFYDPYVSNGADLALNINRVESLEALFAESDIVSLHAPLSEETRDMVNADVLAHAKQGLVLINAARGEIVDLDALYDSMLSDQVGGVGLDVMPEEPLNLERKLIRAWQGEDEWIRDRLLITPHSAFYTPQSLYDMRTKGITVALKYLRTGKLENCVNQEYLKNVRPLT